MGNFLSTGTLKAEDLNREMDTVLTIKKVEQEEFTDKETNEVQKVWFMTFEEIDQKLRLNKTNRELLAKALGTSDTDEVVGKKVALWVKDDVEFAGKIVDGIRLRAKAPK